MHPIKKKQTDKREATLLEEISNLEKQQLLDHRQIDEKRMDFKKYANIKMQGHFIRSRARWIEEGRKKQHDIFVI